MNTKLELGPLEMRVLGLLTGAEAKPVQAIVDELDRDGTKLAYTTVMTVLTRLHEKGLVARVKDGRRYLYRVAGKAPSFAKRFVSRIQGTLFQRDPTLPILALLDDASLSEADLRTLRKRIDEKLRGGDKPRGKA